MIPNDFYGRKQFIWWNGVIEDVQDPLKLGRVRVRIIGIHSQDKTQVPTSSLPWSQSCRSPIGSNTTSGPRPGDWAFGFFQDGDQAQIPIVLGIHVGIESEQSQIVYREYVTGVGATNVPTSTQVDRVVGQPTTALIARGVMEGTLIDKLNNQLEHNCDITKYVEQSVGWIRTQFGYIVEAIRKAIRALLVALGLDPTGESSKLMQVLKSIALEIKKYKGYVDEFNKTLGKMIEYAIQLRAMIDYILSLPERILKLFQECLTKIYTALAQGLTNLFAEPDNLFGKDVDIAGITKQFNEVLSATEGLYTSTLTTISIPGQAVNALLTPASASDVEKAGVDLDNLFTSQTTEGTFAVSEQYTTTINPSIQP
jgi:hypothetical protein